MRAKILALILQDLSFWLMHSEVLGLIVLRMYNVDMRIKVISAPKETLNNTDSDKA